MISEQQERSLLSLADLRDGLSDGTVGKRFEPILIRNARFLLFIFNDPTIEIIPAADAKSIWLVIHKPIDCSVLDLPADAKSMIVKVYDTKFTISVLDSSHNTVYHEDYNMDQFISTYILS